MSEDHSASTHNSVTFKRNGAVEALLWELVVNPTKYTEGFIIYVSKDDESSIVWNIGVAITDLSFDIDLKHTLGGNDEGFFNPKSWIMIETQGTIMEAVDVVRRLPQFLKENNFQYPSIIDEIITKKFLFDNNC